MEQVKGRAQALGTRMKVFYYHWVLIVYLFIIFCILLFYLLFLEYLNEIIVLTLK